MTPHNLLASDLTGYGNLHRAYLVCMNQVVSAMVSEGLKEQAARALPYTVPEVPDLWNHASPAPPPQSIVCEMSRVFPDWIQVFHGHASDMMGPTTVDVAGVDRDAKDVRVITKVAAQSKMQKRRVDHPELKRTVQMAAVYDLYLDLRARQHMMSREPEQAHEAESKRPWYQSIDPNWIILGLGLATAGSHAAHQVLRQRAGTRTKAKRRMSVSELSELIRQQEG